MLRPGQNLVILRVGGWPEKMEIKQTQLQLKLKFKLKLSLAKKKTIYQLSKSLN